MNLSQEELLSQLRQMDEYEFEELVADVWDQRGWETTVTTGSGDRGIDIIVKKDTPFPQKHLIQAKRYSAGNKIGSPDVQQYSSLRQQEDDTDAVVIVTTSSFSRQAEQIANDLNVKLIDGDAFYEMLNGEEDIIRDYIEFTSTQDSAQKKVQNTDDVFEDLYISLIQGIVSGEISSDNVEKEKRDLCREQSLPRIPSNMEILNFASSIADDDDIPDYVFGKSLLSKGELIKYVGQLDLDRHPDINVSESSSSNLKTKPKDETQRDLNQSTDEEETTSGNDNQRDYSNYRKSSRRSYISKQAIKTSSDITKEFKQACEEISRLIIDEEPSSEEIESIKRRVCDKHSSPKVPSNAELVEFTSGKLAVEISTYFGIKEFTAICPICESNSALWKDSHPEKCESCGTEWVEKSKLLRANRWEAEGGPEEGTSKTAKRWRRDVLN